MECTQRLDLECSQVERICPEQIGFLGILGTKYPLMRGPNKIGRDPQTCSIVLNRNSISRQHAVINILNGNKYLLMDLDSANKTKLNNQSLQAYIPVPLTNGDTVQFGEVFGIFRLLEEETDLPCTQAIDIPDTPVIHKNASRVRQATIPESPDVSDKDDSFMMPSQPGAGQFKSPGNIYVKSAARTCTVPAIGSNKIDNIFRTTSKKSNSFILDYSDMSFNESKHNGDIHEAETQPPPTSESTDSIYTAQTQLPTNNGSPSIYSLNTQMPVDNLPAVCKSTNQRNQHEVELDLCTANKENDNNIYNAETQCVTVIKNTAQNIFEANTQLPENGLDSPNTNVFDANNELPFDKTKSEENKLIFEANTQLPYDKSCETINNGDIFEAHNNTTQMPFVKLSDVKNEAENLFEETKSLKINKTPEWELATANVKDSPSSKSDEVIVFNDLDTKDFLDDFQSQTILGSEPLNQDNVFLNQDIEEEIPLSQSDTNTDEDVVINEDPNLEILSQIKPTKRNIRIDSGGSSENTETSQIKPTKTNICIESDDSTDCEDINMLPTQKIPAVPVIDEDLTDIEEDLNLQIKKNDKLVPSSPTIDFEDLETQVIPEAETDKSEDSVKDEINNKPVDAPCFEDMPTQVIPDNVETNIYDIPTQGIPQVVYQDMNDLQFSEEVVSPFKVPIQTPLKAKRKEVTKASEASVLKPSPSKKNTNENDERYYAATQELFEDLCSQNPDKNAEQVDDNEVVPCSVEDYKMGKRFLGLEDEVVLVRDKSSDSSDGEAKIKNLTNLSDKQISDIIGVEISKPKKALSDPSDVEETPKKLRPFEVVQTELPDSQEIKTSVSLSSRMIATESSSESENEKESQEQTPILFRKNRRTKKADVKKDLTAILDVQALPSRIITRTRKPTSKVQESDAAIRKLTSNIFKPNYLTEQDADMSKEIISENISKLKRESDKKNTTKAEESSRNDKTKIEEEPTKKRRTNKTLNNNTVIDLTHVHDELSKISKFDDKGIGYHVSVDESDDKIKNRKTRSRKKSVDAKSKPKRKLDETNIKHAKSEPKNANTKIETQGKITSTNVKAGESKHSSIKVDEGLLTADINKSTRNTRSKSKVIQSDENKSVLSEFDTTKRRRGRPKKDSNEQKEEDKNNKKDNRRRKKDEIMKEPEDLPIRRSTRQKTTKEQPKKLDIQPKINRTHEQSTVYNISSESGSDSPRALKRSGGLDMDMSSPKRTRSMASNNSGVTNAGVTSRSCTPINSTNSSLRSTPALRNKTHRVLFTAFPCEEVKGKLEELGAEIVSDVMRCTVVLTLSLRRTFKLLCAVGLGRPIVGPQWVQACVDTNTIVDPWQYLLKDEASESRFGFRLSRTLAGPRHYLRGYHVSATPHVQPAKAEMKLIVECSGGTWREEGECGERGVRWVAVTCGADRPLWAGLRQRGATLVSAEFILSGVLKQQLDVSAYLIK